MKITTDTLTHIATLSRLKLQDDEKTTIINDMNNIMEMINSLNKVDTQDVIPMAHPMDISQPLRDDIVTETDQRPTFQTLAPHVDHDLYLVPKVID